jgi:hypothetical protein
MGPEQKQLYDVLFGSVRPALGPGLSQLSGLAQGRPEMFEQLEAPAMRQFKEQLAPRLAEQQTARGGGLSSGYLNRLEQASGRFAQDLQSQRLGLQQNALAQLLGLGQNLMQTSTMQPFYQKRRGTAFLEGLGKFAGQLPGLGLGLADLFTGQSALKGLIKAVQPKSETTE